MIGDQEAGMSYKRFSVVDCDGHILESVPELAEFTKKGVRNLFDPME